MDFEGTIDKLQSIFFQILKKKRVVFSLSNFQVRIIEKIGNKDYETL